LQRLPVYAFCCLGKAGLGGGHVAPLLHDGLLDLPGVLPGPGAHLLGDVDTLLSGLEEGDKLGDVLALTLGLEVTGLLGNLLDNGLLLIKALLLTADSLKLGAAKLKNDGLALGLGGVLGDTLLPGRALPPGPLGTLLLGGVSLGHILALLILDILALNNVILNVVLVEPGGAHALGDLLAALTRRLIGQRGVTLLDGLLNGDLLVLDETVLPEVLLAVLLLLGLKVGGVGGVAPLGVAMLAGNMVIILGLLNHDDLVDTTLTSSRNVADAQVQVITRALTGVPGGRAIKVDGLLVVVVIVFVVSMVLLLTLVPVVAPGVEGEGVHERPCTSLLLRSGSGLVAKLGRGGADREGNKANLGNSNHD